MHSFVFPFWSNSGESWIASIVGHILGWTIKVVEQLAGGQNVQRGNSFSPIDLLKFEASTKISVLHEWDRRDFHGLQILGSQYWCLSLHNSCDYFLLTDLNDMSILFSKGKEWSSYALELDGLISKAVFVHEFHCLLEWWASWSVAIEQIATKKHEVDLFYMVDQCRSILWDR